LQKARNSRLRFTELIESSKVLNDLSVSKVLVKVKAGVYQIR